MENSILKSTKKLLNVDAGYTAFDTDIITGINSAFSTLNQLGVGPPEGFAIDSDEATWENLSLPINQLNMVRTYIYLKTRLLFDPPPTSFAIEALNAQILQHEWRLTTLRDETLAKDTP